MIRCQHCNRIFATPSSLKRHISARHSSDTDNHGETRTKYQCSHCHAYFARSETVRRHVRSKHDRDLSTCSFCMKQCRDDYMPQHRAICARKYWQKIQRYTGAHDGIDLEQSQSRPYFPRLSSPSALEEANLHFRNMSPSEALDTSHTLRIVHENTFDGRLAADALTQALWWFVETEDVESYKEALITALRLNITMENVKPPHKQMNRFCHLYVFTLEIDELVRGAIQINDLGYGLGTTILHTACRAGFAEILEPLFWRGACFDVTDEYDETPFDLAIWSGDIDTIRFALALGADPNRTRRLCTTNSGRRQDILILLVEYGADINRVFEGCTLLLAATELCDFDTVRLALSLGANPNLECPLFTAFETGRHDIMRLLVDHGADFDYIVGGMTLLGIAVQGENLEKVRFVLSLGADPNRKDESGHAALHYAAATSGKVPLDKTREVLLMLLEAGADINAQTKECATALMFAAWKGCVELVQLLLDAGATDSVQAYNSIHGETALSLAAEGGHSTVVGLLLEKMPPPDEYGPSLERALWNAVNNDNEEILKQLLLFGADRYAGKVLGLALGLPTSKIVKILLDAGASLDHVNSFHLWSLFNAQQHCDNFSEAPLKCELLIRAFPDLRDRFT